MKKLLLVNTVIVSLIAFFFSLLIFDQFIDAKFYSYQDFDSKYIVIEPDLNLSMNQLMEMFDKYQLSVYKSDFIENEKKYIIYYLNDVLGYVDGLLLKEQIGKVALNAKLDSNSNQLSTKLLNPIKDEHYVVKPMDATTKLGGAYSIVGDRGNDFIDELTYVSNGKFTYSENLQFDIGSNTTFFLYYTSLVLILVVIVTMIQVNIATAKKSKLIKLQKLEGASSLKIWFHLVFIHVIFQSLIRWAIYVVLMKLILNVSLLNLGQLFLYIGLVELFVCLALIVSSGVIYVTISRISINDVVKGKTTYLGQLLLLNMIKFIIIGLTFQFVVTTLVDMSRYIGVQSYAQNFKNDVKEMYYTMGTEYIPDKLLRERTKEVFDYLEANNGMFYYNNLMELSSDTLVVSVTKNYLIQNGFVSEGFVFDETSFYYFFPEGYQTEYAKKIELDSYFGAKNSEVLTYKKSVKPKIYSNLVLSRSLNSNQFIYVYDRIVNEMSSYLFFNYSGSQEQAQRYLDELYEKQGLPIGLYQIGNPYENEVLTSLELIETTLIFSAPILVLIVLLLLSVDMQIIVLGKDKKLKKHKIIVVEGYHPIFKHIDYILMNCIGFTFVLTFVILNGQSLLIALTVIMAYVFLSIILFGVLKKINFLNE